MDVPVVAGGLSGGAQFALEPVGEDPVYYAARFQAAIERATVRWDAGTQDELWEVRRWLHARRGRAVPFWLPTWANDLVLRANITAVATTITVTAVGWAGMTEDKHIMIRTRAGTRYYRRVSAAVAGSSGTEVLTINAALGAAVSLTQIDRISLMHLMRHSADTVDIDHRAGLGGVVAVACEETPE